MAANIWVLLSIKTVEKTFMDFIVVLIIGKIDEYIAPTLMNLNIEEMLE